MYIAQAHKLVKTYGRGRNAVQALRGIDLQIREGRVVGLIGPNGAGKSTFIKCLLGYLVPTSGEMSIFDFAPGDARANCLLGYLPENPNFPEYLTGREIMHYIGRLLGFSQDDIEQQAESLLTEVGIAHAANRRVRSYSKGMAQRLGLAQALVGNPRLLVLDEPMSGLDPVGRATIKEILRNRREQGASIIFCSHVLDDVERLCDEVVMLIHGEVRFQGVVDEVLTSSTSQWVVTLKSSSPPLFGRTEDWTRAGNNIWTNGSVDRAVLPDIYAAAVSGHQDVEIIRVSQQREGLEEMFLSLVQPATRQESKHR